MAQNSYIYETLKSKAMKNTYLSLLLLWSFMGFSQVIGRQSFATGFNNMVEVVHAGDSRLFVVEQDGIIKVLNPNGTTLATPFLNISALVTNGNEQGLLGLAFHPNYATNGYFYVNYTNTAGNTVIARYSVSAGNANVANANSALIMKTITQPFGNHNGGTIKFGQDGYLYIGMGDGGSGGDPGNRAQNKNDLLGKMLRLDVDAAAPYVPATNPYVGIDGADEIWAIGLRNPWKFSFDFEGGHIWIADVGQENVEELNRAPIATPALNYGWRCYEGNAAYNTAGCAAQNTMTFPIAQYSSASGSGNCSVTGGYVYRGTQYPNFVGKYFFADYCSGRIGTITPDGTLTLSPTFSGNPTTFGVDIDNNLYMGAQDGTLYKVIDTSMSVDEFGKFGFSIVPNPASSEISLRTANPNFPLQVAVVDMSGKKIREIQLDNLDTKLNVDDLQAGLYMVSLQDATGAKATSKMVVD